MPTDESLEEQRKRRSEPVTADAIDWGNQFVKHLELEYTNAAALLPAEATWEEFREVMLRAVVATLVDSGAHPEELSRLLQQGVPFDHGVDENRGWTSECNARRIKLIDKMIQQALSAKEALEFGRLTARLRLHVDKEELIPIEGARRLHRRLLETGNPEESSE